TYEEYYTLQSGLEPNTSATLNIQFNETVNKASDNILVAAADGQSGSDILHLTITTQPGSNYNSIQAQPIEIPAEEVGLPHDSTAPNVYETQNDALKIIIILLSLLIGAGIGIVTALSNRNISTEEDIEHYLGERTLGTF